ncbi:MAG TPA: helix-turn-helix transcriptional regulator [Tepidisphaeraceae bacterium]|nr:helix-turn-helix transcriptional regulator [Tepidisphaeraceae bacterium]
MTFGEFVKDRRIKFGLTLRAFCERNGYDPGNHSKLERGILNPPDDEEYMGKLAKALNVKKETSDWFDFHNYAAVARKEIPSALMDDAEVVDKLPVLFRTLQGEPLPAEKMDDLIDFIRSRQ